MTRRFLNLALRAASNPGCTLLVNNTLGMLSKQVEEEINDCTDNVEHVTVPINVAPPSDLVSTARLKKKEVQTKTSKRKKKHGLIRNANLQRREVRKRDKAQWFVAAEKYISFSLIVFSGKRLSCI